MKPINPNETYLTTPEVAERLGISIRRVQALIHAGRLPSIQIGRDHIIKESDLSLVAERKQGRPKKNIETASKPAKKGRAIKKPASAKKGARKK